MCRLIELEPGEVPGPSKEQEILTAFKTSEHYEYFQGLRSISDYYQQDLEAVLLPEYDVQNVTGESYIWKISSRPEGDLRIKSIRLREFQEWLQQIRGEKAGIDKGLILGTSAVECYLAKAGNIFPGDADAVLVDEYGHIRHLVEFKKHTKAQEKIDDHLAELYYRRRKGDKRKYQSLRALVEAINQKPPGNIHLTIIYYTTRGPKRIRLQEVTDIGRVIKVGRDSKTRRLDRLTDEEIGEKIIERLNSDKPW